MKRKYFLPLLIFSCSVSKAEIASKLSEAIQRRLITINIIGAKADTSFHEAYSSHYGSCMAMEVTNTSSESLNLNLEYGYKLEPVDSSIQTMLVTQTLLVKLQPKQRKNYRIYAMCTEAHDGGPSTDAEFLPGKRTTGNLLGLAELINRKKYQNDAAQNAVWCLTDGYDIESIFSADTTMMYNLKRFVAKAKGIPLTRVYEIPNDKTYSAPLRTFTTRTVYSGSLSYSFVKPSKVMIALFDEDNHMKRIYVNNETQHEGQFTYNYQISSDEMNNKKHYLRMIRDGKLEEEISIIPRE